MVKVLTSIVPEQLHVFFFFYINSAMPETIFSASMARQSSVILTDIILFQTTVM